jgi:hypothetical protein
MRHTRATFKTDPLNLLAYTADPAEPFSAADQDRNAYSTGCALRLHLRAQQATPHQGRVPARPDAVGEQDPAVHVLWTTGPAVRRATC